MGNLKKKRDSDRKLAEKKFASYVKFYEMYKDKSLEELRDIWQSFPNPPGGTKRQALLALAEEKQSIIRQKTMMEAAEAVKLEEDRVKQEEVKDERDTETQEENN